MSDLETRALPANIEIRAAATGGRVAVGYAALFNSPADIGGAWIERIAPGAFAETLRSDDQLALFGHDMNRVLGRRSAGTLKLEEDDKGLRFELELPDTTDGRDLAVLLERGDIKGNSFGFRTRHDEWDETASPPQRTLHSVDLFEISPTADPAYTDTTIGLRSLDAAKKSRRAQNYSAARTRLRLKATLDLRTRSTPAS
jgi:HK97 family phage prohead protease